MPIICEGYGRVYYFHYRNWKHDPRPRALFLGRFIHPSTRNRLMSAINLNYLSEGQIIKLQKNLQDILSFSRNGYYRYWRARQLGLNDILSTAYRTYRVDRIDGIEGISPSTLRFIAEGIKQERQSKVKIRKPLPEPSVNTAEKPEAEFEKPPEKLPPEVEKAKVPPPHPDEKIDISKTPPEEIEKLKKGAEPKPEPKPEVEPEQKPKPQKRKPEPKVKAEIEPEEPEEEEDDDTEWDLTLGD